MIERYTEKVVFSEICQYFADMRQAETHRQFSPVVECSKATVEHEACQTEGSTEMLVEAESKGVFALQLEITALKNSLDISQEVNDALRSQVQEMAEKISVYSVENERLENNKVNFLTKHRRCLARLNNIEGLAKRLVDSSS